MLLLLKETLEYLEKQQKLLKKANILSVATCKQFDKLKSKLSIEIKKLVNKNQPQIVVKTEPGENDAYFETAENIRNKTQNKAAGINKREKLQKTIQRRKYTRRTRSQAGLKQRNKATEKRPTGVIIKAEFPEENFASTIGNEATDSNSFKATPACDSDTSSGEEDIPNNDESSGNKNDTQLNELNCDSDKTEYDSPDEQDTSDVIALTQPDSDLCGKLPSFLNALEQLLPCRYCQKCFVESELEDHIMSSHLNDMATFFQCTICKTKFSRKETLQNHMKSLHNHTRQFECDVCQRRFKLKQALTRHLKQHETHRPHECNLCNKRFVLKQHLKIHSFTHTGERPHKCTECDWQFAQRTALKKHMLTHTGEKPFECLVCGRRFSQSAGVANHMLTHTKVKKFQCELCDKAFSWKQNLSEHMYTHTKESTFVCDICGKKCRRPGCLERHKLTHIASYGCTICNESFTQRKLLSSHMRKHEQDIRTCKICQVVFPNKSAFKKHNVLHDPKRLYKCEICNRRYQDRRCLLTHKRVHCREKSFKCSFCSKTFLHEHSMKSHMILHGAKPFECTVCSKKFSSNQYLKFHMYIHTGERPFKCSECGKGFKQRTHLRTHKMTHTNSRPYKCQFCGKGFTQSSHMRTHEFIHLKDGSKSSNDKSNLKLIKQE